MGAKKTLPQTRDLSRFEELVRQGQPCILDLPLGKSELVALRQAVFAALEGDRELSVFIGDTCDIGTVQACDFRRDFDEAGANSLNLIEHELTPPEVARLFLPRSFASAGVNLFRRPDGVINPISLVASPRFTFTVPHVDSGAFGNWMALVEGKKLWMLVSPADEHTFFDPQKKVWAFGDENRTNLIHYGMLGPNQLLFAPPGWLHSVITLERSVGYGGQYLTAADVAPCKRMVLTMLERGVENPDYLVLYERLEEELLPPPRAHLQA